MNNYKKNQYKRYLIKYLEKEYGIKIKEKNRFDCPVCHKEETAVIYPNNVTKFYCLSPQCKFKGDIFSLIKATKNNKMSDEKLADYLHHKLDNVLIQDDLDKIFELYTKNNFSLFPIARGTKIPTIEQWQKSSYKNPEEWHQWLEQNQDLGLNIGTSGICIVDIDDKKTYERMKDLMGDTLVQQTERGWHFVYKEDKDFFKTLNKVLRNDGHEMELRVSGAYCVVAPSSVNGEVRKWNNNKISEMPSELKDFFMKYYKDEPKVEKNDDIENDIKNDNLRSTKLTGLDGCCNDTFIKFGGILRKKMPTDYVEYALYNFNQMLQDPMSNKQIKAVCRQIEKYDRGDLKELADKIFKHLKVVEEGSSFEIATSLRSEKKDVENALKYLQDNGKVFKRGKIYKAVNKAEWRNTFIDESKILPFEVPYFKNHAIFRNGDMIVIGAKPGAGKSVIAMNIIKKFVDQGIKPYYINLESGNRFVTNAMKLGLKEGDFNWTNHYSPQNLELENNAVTILDWLLPDNYAETDKLYARFSSQLDRHGGILIVFVQLKKWKDTKNKEHYDFFASSQLDMFPAFVCKYLYGDGYDNENTYFETTKIRESKTGLQYLTIPTHFDKETKLLELR